MKTIFLIISLLLSFELMAYECIKSNEFVFDKHADQTIISDTCIANKLDENLNFECAKNCARIKCPDKSTKMSSIIEDDGSYYNVWFCIPKQKYLWLGHDIKFKQ